MKLKFSEDDKKLPPVREGKREKSEINGLFRAVEKGRNMKEMKDYLGRETNLNLSTLLFLTFK